MNKEIAIVKNISIIYLWYHHFNPKINEKKIETIINNHDWETFKRWLEWQKTQDLLYFPETAPVFINEKYYGELLINEENFNLITDNDYECG